MSSPGNQQFYARRFFSVAVLAPVILFGAHRSAHADLQITEVMIDPLDGDVWEWIEVRNTDGAPIDLHGALGDRLGDPRILPTDPVSIDNLKASNTAIPGGGVAVLYDANLPGNTDADFDDQLFRDAWELSGAVPLIGVDFFPELTNGGSIGFWEDYSAYQQDLVNPGFGFVVDSFDHALFGIDFQNGFPAAQSGTSMRWNGQGNYQDGANWTLSADGVLSAVTSVSASIEAPINSTLDLASPGFQPAGSFRSALVITELMANPDSDQPDWEWIEVYNGTGGDLNLSGYVLDDRDGDDLPAANIASGLIPKNTTAVLYNGDALSRENMEAAWDPNNAMGTNFIEVENFSELATAETIALWDDFAQYESEAVQGPGRSTDNATTVLDYGDDGLNWPSFNGFASNYLMDPSADPNAGNYGLFWETSTSPGDGISFHAAVALGDVEVHSGGDVGSPGLFETPIFDADFDNDNDVDGIDFLTWQLGLGTGTTHAEGDANEDGVVDGADLAIWEDQYGTILSSADFDNDDDVDGDDLLAWQRGYQVGSTHAAGDANGDGTVNGADLAVWVAQYGTFSPLSEPLGGLSRVPEPTSMSLLLLTLSGWPRFSRWRAPR